MTEIIEKYNKYKSQLKIGPRYLEAFEFRYGLIDGLNHTYKETGKRLGVTQERIRQMVARLLYELDRVEQN